VQVGYSISIRTALGGGAGLKAFAHLSHEFLVVSPAGGGGGYHVTAQELIVDPHFREQFDIPQVSAVTDGDARCITLTHMTRMLRHYDVSCKIGLSQLFVMPEGMMHEVIALTLHALAVMQHYFCRVAGTEPHPSCY